MTPAPHKFGQRTPEELKAASDALTAVRTFRDRFAKSVPPAAEFFEPNHKLDIESRKTRQRKLKYFNQTSLAQALLLRHEFAIKLVCSLDGYLIAADSKNPILTFLAARYVLELLATVNFIVSGLNAAKATDLRDWEGRGRRFLVEICRGRFGSSDPRINQFLSGAGVSKAAREPIKIVEAIKLLSVNEAFSPAEADYDYLSNICHHNGSSHQLFQASMRETTEVSPPYLPAAIRAMEPSTAVTLEYPPVVAANTALIQTVKMVLSASAWVEVLLGDMPSMPFTDEEVAQLTNGQVQNSLNYLKPSEVHLANKMPRSPESKVGRNAPCPCGSGKKYKHCCLV